MNLRKLQIENLRCIESAGIEPAPVLNVLAGRNGSGKTSVLESIHLVGYGRSFRGGQLRDAVRWEANGLSVFAEFSGKERQRETVGFEQRAGRRRVRISGRDVASAAELVRRFPMLLVTPETQRVLGDGVRQRRQLLDWTVFHVEPRYGGLLRRFRRSLAQRNALLKEQQSSDGLAEAWERELAEAGEELGAVRERAAAELGTGLAQSVRELVGFEVEVVFQRGWPLGESLSEALEKSRARDRSSGRTHLGPQRADLRFKVRGSPAQAVLSRGEGKLFVVAVLLGHLRHVVGKTGGRPLVLVDDLASELDEHSRTRLMGQLVELGSQVFVTSVDASLVPIPRGTAARVFHVEQGQLRPVV